VRCSYIKRNKKQCRANALSGGQTCYLHSQPGLAAEAGSKGGRRRAIFRPEELKRFAPAKTTADLVDVVSQTLTDARNGVLDAKVANAIGGLASVMMKLFEATTFEERLRRLETFREEYQRGRRTN
jgi:hypothetical protein